MDPGGHGWRLCDGRSAWIACDAGRGIDLRAAPADGKDLRKPGSCRAPDRLAVHRLFRRRQQRMVATDALRRRLDRAWIDLVRASRGDLPGRNDLDRQGTA